VGTLFVSDFRGSGFSVFLLSMMLSIGLSDIVFTMLRYILSIFLVSSEYLSSNGVEFY
jgi:hypothetical protein